MKSRTLKTIYNALNNNKVTFILLSTVVLGYLYSSIEWSADKHYHWSGRKGFNFHWHMWIVLHFVTGLMFQISRFVKKISDIDKDVMLAYLSFDLYSLFWYFYNGWPEPTEEIINGFILACIIFITIRLCRFYR